MNFDHKYLKQDNNRIVVLDGTICSDIHAFYNTIEYQLSLPTYFGRNLDALEEILFDLEWIDEDQILFVLINEAHFLNAEVELKPIVLDILKNEENLSVKFIELKG